MEKKDCIIRGLLFENSIAASLIDCTELVNICIQKHKLKKLSAEAMARVLLVACYISSNLKNEADSCSITIKGNGVGGDIFVSGNQKLQMRGYIANPHVQDDKLDITACIGKNGTITVLYQDNGKSFMGTTNLIAGDITEDFIAYFTQSEQRYTDLHLEVHFDEAGRCQAACGLFLQALPQVDDLQIQSAVMLMQTFYDMDKSLFISEHIDTIWERYLQSEKLKVQYPKYECTCSRERMQTLLLTLGKAEIESILKEQGKVEIHCQYCNTDYIFLKKDMDELFATR